MARSYSGGGSGDNQVLALVQMRTVTQLRNYEIQPEQINVQKVAMTSSMWVCCCHDTRRKRHKRLVTIVNINSKEPHARSWPTIADSAAMNPTNPLIALKGGKTIEVFDLPRRKLIHRCTMDDPIAYSSWISSEVIVIVTTSIVYHWNITAVESEPCRVFQRHGRLKHCQLVKYKIDKKMKWMALTGLYMEASGYIRGITQVYSCHYRLSQCIDAYAVEFCDYQCNSNPTTSTVVCIATRTPAKQGKLHILELGPHLAGNTSLSNHCDELNFSQADEFRHDFPVAMEISELYGLVFILTKFGWLLLCDLESGFQISTVRVTNQIMFTSSLTPDSKGIVGVCKNGKVLSIRIQEGELLQHLQCNCKKIVIAQRLAKQFTNNDKKRIYPEYPFTRYDTAV